MSIEPCYTLEYFYQSAIATHILKKVTRHWWAPLYPQGNCKFGRNQWHCWIFTPKECC